MKRHLLKAKKSYGQHFLKSEEIAERIARSLTRLSDFDHVIEVGPGRGMLTKYLLDQAYSLIAIEADRDMILYLNKHYPELKERIVSADFLKLDLAQLLPNKSFAIIGNFPYNISSQILFRMLEHREQIPELVGMFQREMGQRVVAPPGNKTYGVISVLVQAYYEGEYLFTVDRSQFNPPPEVQSGVIRLVRKENFDLGCSHKLFRQVVKQSFSQRRKMLRNTMKSFIKGHEILQTEFFQQRPERLSVEDFVWLTQQIAQIQKESKPQDEEN